MKGPHEEPTTSSAGTLVVDAGCEQCEAYAKKAAARGVATSAEDVDAVQWHGAKAYSGAAAVVRVAWAMGGLYRLWGTLLWLVPSPLREWVYQRVKHDR